MEVLALKLTSGGSDRASKILKFAEDLKKKLKNSYVHFPCDNHMTETAWEKVQELRRVEIVEDTVKLSYSIFKNSASRKLNLANIARSFEQKSLKPRSIFEIKYLTSELDATRALKVDYLQIMKLASDLSTDTSIKKDNRKKMKKLFSLLQDARVLIGLVALNSVLGNKRVAPYQL